VLAGGQSISSTTGADCGATNQLTQSNNFYVATDCWAKVVISKAVPSTLLSFRLELFDLT